MVDAIVSSHVRSLHYDALLASLLLDNVQQHAEGGRCSSLFLCTHALVDAAWQPKAVFISAGKLCDEIRFFWRTLQGLPIASLAVSKKTLLASQGSFPAAEERHPILHYSVYRDLPYEFKEAKVLGDAFGALVVGLTEVALDAPRRSRLTVHVTRAHALSRRGGMGESF